MIAPGYSGVLGGQQAGGQGGAAVVRTTFEGGLPLNCPDVRVQVCEQPEGPSRRRLCRRVRLTKKADRTKSAT
jgi:hypothetical protein